MGPRLIAELAHPELADVPIFGSIGFLVGDIPADVRTGILRARIYVGYSGWGPGQLEAEMAEDSWIVEPARDEDVSTDEPEAPVEPGAPAEGPEFRQLSRMPFDPSMN